MSSERMDQSDKSTGGAGRPNSPRAASSSGSQDPDVLAAEIERTREDLAETLDEIADRVSPKRVASRGKQKLSETVREKTAVAKEVVAEKTAVAKEVVAEKTAVAKEKAATAQAAVSEKAATAKGAVSDRVGQSGAGSSAASSVRLEQDGGTGAGTGAGSSAAAGVAASGAPGPGAEPLPPVTGVEVPTLAPDRPTPPTAPLSTSSTSAVGRATGSGPSGGTSTWSTSNPLLAPEALAGGAAALLGLWLLLRRRR